MTDRRPISFTYMEGAQDHKITKDYDDNLYYDDNKKIIHVESTSNSESQELKSFNIKYIEEKKAEIEIIGVTGNQAKELSNFANRNPSSGGKRKKPTKRRRHTKRRRATKRRRPTKRRR